MMQVALFHQRQRHLFTFDPSVHDWKRQNGKFLIGLPTGLPAPMEQVFVKKWDKALASAHPLLMLTIQEPLPHTPRMLGHATEHGDHYYFMENLPAHYKLLDKIISTGEGDALRNRLNDLLITRNIGARITWAAIELFDKINSRGFVYPDFTHKNIMINWLTSDVRFIDLDSCFSKDKLSFQMPSAATQFAIVYWGAWREKIGIETPEAMSRSMVLSFAAVWAKAVAMLRSGHAVREVQKTIRTPSFATVQAPFWDSIINNDIAAFQSFFHLDADDTVAALFEHWTILITSLKDNQEVPWDVIASICHETFSVAHFAPTLVSVMPVVANNPTTTTKADYGFWTPIFTSGTMSQSDYMLGVFVSSILALTFLFSAATLPEEIGKDIIEKISLAIGFAYNYAIFAMTTKRARDYGKGMGIALIYSSVSFIAALFIAGSSVELFSPIFDVRFFIVWSILAFISCAASIFRPSSSNSSNN